MLANRSRTVARLQGPLWMFFGTILMMVLALEPTYLDFDNLPDTNFSCVGKVIGGYYADIEANCQMFHVCTIGQLDEPMDIRFLCLNGTVFDQETRVCERIDEVDCSNSEQFYSLNLELYGNTQTSSSDDSSETDPPIIIKSSNASSTSTSTSTTTTTTTTSTTTSTTTTTTTHRPRTTPLHHEPRPIYFTTPSPAPPLSRLTSSTSRPKLVSSHHFPLPNRHPTDIRFNPAEININLNPDRPPDIHQHKFHFSFNHNPVISHTTDYRTHAVSTQPPSASPPKSIVNYGLTHSRPSSGSDYRYNQHQYYQHNNFKSSSPSSASLSHPLQHPYLSQIRNSGGISNSGSNSVPTTSTRKPISFAHKPLHPYHLLQSHHTHTSNYHHTDKPHIVSQLSHPMLRHSPHLMFSSPAPFSVAKPPRIIISASASVSDANGRKLNYSLGTIGSAELLSHATVPVTLPTYDDDNDYRDEDVILDPFYQDVPKLRPRVKRDAPPDLSPARDEQEAVDILKFLFDWYRNQVSGSRPAIPLVPKTISDINEQLKPVANNTGVKFVTVAPQPIDYSTSKLFTNSKFNIIGGGFFGTSSSTTTTTTTTTTTNAPPLPPSTSLDYIDDNYEPLTYPNTTQDSNTENYHYFPEGYTEIPSTLIIPTVDQVVNEAAPSEENAPSTPPFFDYPVLTQRRMISVPNRITTEPALLKSAKATSGNTSHRRRPQTTPLSNRRRRIGGQASPTRRTTTRMTTTVTHTGRPKKPIHQGAKAYVFTCVGKTVNRFYSDKRDCRLFHYCTSGYSPTQLVDMKFVCEHGTFFDDQQLVCTKTLPPRCSPP